MWCVFSADVQQHSTALYNSISFGDDKIKKWFIDSHDFCWNKENAYFLRNTHLDENAYFATLKHTAESCAKTNRREWTECKLLFEAMNRAWDRVGRMVSYKYRKETLHPGLWYAGRAPDIRRCQRAAESERTPREWAVHNGVGFLMWLPEGWTAAISVRGRRFLCGLWSGSLPDFLFAGIWRWVIEESEKVLNFWKTEKRTG